MAILVTGGAGFIGSHVSDALLAQGHKVVILDNLSTGKKENLQMDHHNLKFIECDINNIEDFQDIFGNIDIIFHLAACVSVQKSIANPAFSKSVNVDGFFNILQAARKHNVKKFIFASSAAVYGDPQSFPIKETDKTQPTSPYGLEKLIAEQYLNIYHHLYGLDYICARFFNVYGQRQDPKSPYSGVISIFEERAKAGKTLHIFGDGQQKRDFIAVDDLVKFLMSLAFSNHNGVFNIGTGTETSITALARRILEQYNRPVDDISYFPQRSGDIIRSQADISKLKNVIKK